MARFRHIVRNRNFSLLWFSQIVSQFGDRLNQMALLALIYRFAPGSTIQIAKLMAFTIIPVFLIGPMAGVYVDRWDRRRTMGEMLLEGDAGVARLDGDGGVWQRAHGENSEQPVNFPWEDRGFAGDSVFATQQHILAHITEGTPLANTASEYLQNMRVVDAAYRSSQTGAWVTP